MAYSVWLERTTLGWKGYHWHSKKCSAFDRRRTGAVCSAMKTVPNPPSPMRWRILYRPPGPRVVPSRGSRRAVRASRIAGSPGRESGCNPSIESIGSRASFMRQAGQSPPGEAVGSEDWQDWQRLMASSRSGKAPALAKEQCHDKKVTEKWRRTLDRRIRRGGTILVPV